MADYAGRDQRLKYLFQNGGGGGGSCKVISGYYHNGDFYEDQSYTQIITGDTECLYIDLDTTTLYLFDGTDYVEVQGGGGSGGGSFTCDLLLENTDFSIASGSATSERQYTLSASIENYDGVLVVGFTNVNANDRNQAVSMIILKASYNIGSSVRWTYLLNGSIPNNNRRLAFGFSDSTTIQTAATRPQYEEPRLYRVYGLNFGGFLRTYSTTEQVVGTWIDGKPLYERVITFTGLPQQPMISPGTIATLTDEEVKRIEAYATIGSMAVLPSGSEPYRNTDNDQIFFNVTINANNVIRYTLKSGTNSSDTADGWVIIQYTKTTD